MGGIALNTLEIAVSLPIIVAFRLNKAIISSPLTKAQGLCSALHWSTVHVGHPKALIG